MERRELLLQRALDGALPREQALAVERMAVADAELGATDRALTALDAGLRDRAAPLRAADAARQSLLAGRIVDALPVLAPVRHVRVRAVDLLYAVAAAALVVVAYGLLGSTAQTLLGQTVALTWIVGLSLVVGLGLLLAPGFLRSLESGTLGRIFGRPVAIGPADALVYRAVGAAVVVGGVWLAW